LVRDGIFSLECKPSYVSETPFDETLLLDTDTFVCRDLRPAFGLLRYYDLLVQWGGNQFNHPDGLQFHARACSGAILYKRSSHVIAVMHEWTRQYQVECVAKGENGIADERALTIALASSQIRVGALPSFFHVNLTTPWVFNSPPVVLHGRFGNLSRLSISIADGWDQEQDWHPRVWLPGIRGLLPRGVRRSDPFLALSLIFRRVINSMRLGIK